MLIFGIASLVLTSAPQLETLIARLQDHARTLKQAEADRAAADAQLDADLAADAPAVGNAAQNEAAAKAQAGE